MEVLVNSLLTLSGAHLSRAAVHLRYSCCTVT